jgi:hypothetical protein
MTAGDAQLFRTTVLEIVCERSSAGQTAEVHDGTGTPLATSDGAGTIRDRGGADVLRTATSVEGPPRRNLVHARLTVSDAAGAALGEVRVVKYSSGPRSSKATLSVVAGDAEVARLEPQDRKGEEIAVTAGGTAVGTLRQTSRKRGLLRSSTTYRLELTGDLDAGTRPLVLAAAIRYHALVAATVNAAARDR